MQALKDSQRRVAYDARNKQTNKNSVSAKICDTFTAQAAYQEAETVMWYCHCRSEVRTLPALKIELLAGKQIVVPYCTQDQTGKNKLGLWKLEALDELVPGMWDILEPPRHRWGETGKEISPEQLDLIMLPGVAFDRNGGRLGNGGGYYDRLLTQVRSDAILSAVCYEAQIFDQVIMQSFDIYMHYVITEHTIYICKSR